jgi:hypothetical protein
MKESDARLRVKVLTDQGQLLSRESNLPISRTLQAVRQYAAITSTRRPLYVRRYALAQLFRNLIILGS